MQLPNDRLWVVTAITESVFRDWKDAQQNGENSDADAALRRFLELISKNPIGAAAVYYGYRAGEEDLEILEFLAMKGMDATHADARAAVIAAQSKLLAAL